MTTIRRLLLTLLLLAGVAPALAADGGYITDAALRDRALAALVAAAGETRPISRLTFTPDEIVLRAQPDSGRDLVEWRARRLDLVAFTHNWIGGPQRVVHSGLVDDPAGSYFRLGEIDPGLVSQVVAAAVAYAGLQGAPVVERVEIARAESLLPNPGYGDIRWTVSLGTPDEHALAYADAAGTIIGGDLSNTERVRRLDFLGGDTWPMAEAQAQLAAALGTARAHRVRIGERSITVTADHPADKALQRDYSWSVEGVTYSLVDLPNFVELGLGGGTSFGFGAVDLTRLPAVKAAALEAFDSPGAAITGLEASMPIDTPAAVLRVLWRVDMRQADGETGRAWVDTSGRVVEMELPDGRMPEIGPWLAPETLAHTLARIAETFGADAKIFSITVDDSQASIDIEDPRAPGTLAQFLVDGREIVRFGSASFMADLAPDHVFTMADLAPLTAERLGDMAGHTLARVNVEGGSVYRYTISRQALILDPGDTRLLVEVRAGRDNGNAGGWVTFTLAGEEVDALLP